MGTFTCTPATQLKAGTLMSGSAPFLNPMEAWADTVGQGASDASLCPRSAALSASTAWRTSVLFCRAESTSDASAAGAVPGSKPPLNIIGVDGAKAGELAQRDFLFLKLALDVRALALQCRHADPGAQVFQPGCRPCVLPHLDHVQVLLQVLVLLIQGLALLPKEERGVEDLCRLVGNRRCHLVHADPRRGKHALRKPDLDIPFPELGDHLVEAEIEVPHVDRDK